MGLLDWCCPPKEEHTTAPLLAETPAAQPRSTQDANSVAAGMAKASGTAEYTPPRPVLAAPEVAKGQPAHDQATSSIIEEEGASLLVQCEPSKLTNPAQAAAVGIDKQDLSNVQEQNSTVDVAQVVVKDMSNATAQKVQLPPDPERSSTSEVIVGGEADQGCNNAPAPPAEIEAPDVLQQPNGTSAVDKPQLPAGNNGIAAVTEATSKPAVEPATTTAVSDKQQSLPSTSSDAVQSPAVPLPIKTTAPAANNQGKGKNKNKGKNRKR